MSEGAIVDWGLAGTIAGAMAANPQSGALDEHRVAELSARGLARALRYSALTPASDVPEVEIVSRRAWLDANLAELRALFAPVEARAAAELRLPWPIAGPARAALGAAGAAEIGAATGYASRRVLGQYLLPLSGRTAPPRMLLVGANVSGAASELELELDPFLEWVAIHEHTHSIQFASVPWLHGHIAGLIQRMIEATAGGLDFGALAAAARRLVTSDPRAALERAMRGELARALAGPDQAALLDEMQAVMAVIEGHAEHVMDAAAADDGELEHMRRRMDEHRARRGGLADIIARVLGLGMKLRQYELGKAWADGVVARRGVDGLNRVWDDPSSLPSLSELEDPEAWVARALSAQPA